MSTADTLISPLSLTSRSNCFSLGIKPAYLIAVGPKSTPNFLCPNVDGTPIISIPYFRIMYTLTIIK